MTAAEQPTRIASPRVPEIERVLAGRRPLLGPARLACAAALCVCASTFAISHDEAALPLQPVADPPLAPALELEDLYGHAFTFDNREDRVALVNFWATWCPPCRKELPALDRLAQRLQGQPFTLIAVNVGEDPERIWAFFDSLSSPPGFAVVLDRTGEVSRAWGVKVVPTTWIVDLERRIVFGAVGEVDFDSDAVVSQIQTLTRAGAHALSAGTADPPHSERHR